MAVEELQMPGYNQLETYHSHWASQQGIRRRIQDWQQKSEERLDLGPNQDIISTDIISDVSKYDGIFGNLMFSKYDGIFGMMA